MAVKIAFSPPLKKTACLVRERKKKKNSSKICESSYWTPWRPSSDSDVIVSQCEFPHSLFSHSITPAPPLPSGPLLASVPMLHGLNSKSKDAGQSTRPKHQPTGAVTAVRHPLLSPAPKGRPMWLPSANRAPGCQLFAIAVRLSDNQTGGCSRGHPSHSSVCWRAGLLGWAEATP